MHSSLHESGDGMITQFRGDAAHLRSHFFPQLATTDLHDERLEEASQSEAAPASEALTPEQLRTVRTNIAAATARLPITTEMAWTVPQLLKRVQLLATGAQTISGVLRSLIRMPELDEQFAKAFADSGFLSCDLIIARARWKYDLAEMKAKHSEGSDSEVLAHCGVVLSRHRMKQPLDWEAVMIELQTLNAWFPELRTIRLLQQLYERLHALHLKSVRVAQCWLDWRAGRAGAISNSIASAFALQGVPHA
jgi:hypothetical protein